MKTILEGGRDIDAYVACTQDVFSGGSLPASPCLTATSRPSTATRKQRLLSVVASSASRRDALSRAVIHAGSAEMVCAGDTDFGALASGSVARQYVLKVGPALSATVIAGGQQHVRSGADVQETQIKPVGGMHLSKGVSLSSVFISKGGFEILYVSVHDSGETFYVSQIVMAHVSADVASIKAGASPAPSSPDREP